MNRKTSTLLSLGISIALIALGIWFLCNHQKNLGYDDDGWTMPYHMMITGESTGIILIVFWIATFSAIGLVVSGLISNHSSSARKKSKNSSDTTKSPKHHNARRKVDKNRFETMKQKLS